MTSNMKSLFLSIGTLLLLASCHNSATVSSEYTVDSSRDISNITDSYLIALDADTTKISPYDHIFNQGANGYILPKGGRASKLDGKVYKKGMIETEIYVDDDIADQYVADTTVTGMVNIVLEELYFGMELNVGVDASAPNGTIRTDISLVNTDDTVNVENIVAKLVGLGKFKKDKQLHIYLFDRASFFKTANAIAFESENHKFIFGSAYLFKNPMLFVHELGHVLGLNHTSAVDSLDRCYNVMHESSIGCANHVHPRQSLAVASGHLTPYFDDDSILFPVGVTCGCESEAIYKSKFQKYLNSIDRGIGDEELVGNVEVVKNAFANIDNLPDEFERNFRRQADAFFDPSDTDLIDTFVQWSIEAQIALRKNNLLRLTAATVDKLNPNRGNNTLSQVMELGTMTELELQKELDTVRRQFDPNIFYQTLDTAVLRKFTELNAQVVDLEATVRDLDRKNKELNRKFESSVIIDKNCSGLYRDGAEASPDNYSTLVLQLMKKCAADDR